MPYRVDRSSAVTNSRTSRASAVIELSIPMRIMRGSGGDEAAQGGDEDDSSCYICANAFCASDSCCRSMTHLGCCTQAICCGCLLKSSKRCTCKEDCDAVISLCPFCREVSPVEALDVFLGAKAACAACLKADAATEAEATPATPSHSIASGGPPPGAEEPVF